MQARAENVLRLIRLVPLLLLTSACGGSPFTLRIADPPDADVATGESGAAAPLDAPKSRASKERPDAATLDAPTNALPDANVATDIGGDAAAEATTTPDDAQGPEAEASDDVASLPDIAPTSDAASPIPEADIAEAACPTGGPAAGSWCPADVAPAGSYIRAIGTQQHCWLDRIPDACACSPSCACLQQAGVCPSQRVWNGCNENVGRATVVWCL